MTVCKKHKVLVALSVSSLDQVYWRDGGLKIALGALGAFLSRKTASCWPLVALVGRFFFNVSCRHAFEAVLGRIFDDFGLQNGAKIDQKSSKNVIRLGCGAARLSRAFFRRCFVEFRLARASCDMHFTS